MTDRPSATPKPRLGLIRLRMAGATLPDRAAASIAAALAILLAGWATLVATGPLMSAPMLIGPIGASAVLAFAVPTSPLAQPWSVIGGNMLSALVGWGIALLIPDVAVAAGVAVGAAIVVMTMTRSLHPPGGATALTAVLLYDAGVGSWLVPLVPITLNSIVLVAVAWAFHRWQRRSYPHRPAPIQPGHDLLHPEDVRAGVRDMGEVFDITQRDLEAIFAHAARHREQRIVKR